MDLSCQFKKHGEILRPSEDMGLVEFKCPRRACGAIPNRVIVLHVFRTDTGVLFRTDRFKQPPVEEQEEEHASQHNSASVRSA